VAELVKSTLAEVAMPEYGQVGAANVGSSFDICNSYVTPGVVDAPQETGKVLVDAVVLA
jgi:hypothetical protein